MSSASSPSTVDADNLVPSLDPLTWPQLPVVSALGVLVAALPAVVAPRPVGEAGPTEPMPALVREPVAAGGPS